MLGSTLAGPPILPAQSLIQLNLKSMVIRGSLKSTGNLLLLNIQLCFVLEPPKIVPFSFGSTVVDSGEFAQLTCVVSKGDTPITITWSLKGQELNSGPSITTTMLGRRASMLVISSVDYSHVGEYTCRATNPAGSVTHSANLRVNGKHTSSQEGTENLTKLPV